VPVAAPVQARSRERRDLLLRAVIDLVAESGVRGVTHRSVAARAGLPPATTTYYFASIDDLINEALALHVDERADEVERLAADAAGGGRSPAQVAERFATDLAARSVAALTVQFELYLEAGRSAAMREPARAALERFSRIAADALEQLGVRDPDDAAVALLALIDGFALHRIARPRHPAAERESLRQAMVDLLASRLA
jgi:DNA-binding transcriptional regulator YbjK